MRPQYIGVPIFSRIYVEERIEKHRLASLSYSLPVRAPVHIVVPAVILVAEVLETLRANAVEIEGLLRQLFAAISNISPASELSWNLVEASKIVASRSWSPTFCFHRVLKKLTSALFIKRFALHILQSIVVTLASWLKWNVAMFHAISLALAWRNLTL